MSKLLTLRIDSQYPSNLSKLVNVLHVHTATDWSPGVVHTFFCEQSLNRTAPQNDPDSTLPLFYAVLPLLGVDSGTTEKQ